MVCDVMSIRYKKFFEKLRGIGFKMVGDTILGPLANGVKPVARWSFTDEPHCSKTHLVEWQNYHLTQSMAKLYIFGGIATVKYLQVQGCFSHTEPEHTPGNLYQQAMMGIPFIVG